jgi:hypothetical protein
MHKPEGPGLARKYFQTCTFVPTVIISEKAAQRRAAFSPYIYPAGAGVRKGLFVRRIKPIFRFYNGAGFCVLAWEGFSRPLSCRENILHR